ncbi:MAG: 50S ribosomal protein L4 [Deltaproteobacteria bacterium]|nr:MAG: 50S ribosomal protein L4 [Deltaproteobacteria bacterium]
MKLDVYNIKREKVGDVDVSDEVFGTEVKPHLHHLIVRWQQAKKRAGTHAVLNRHVVNGTTKKQGRQKGSGRARHGSRKAPIFVGGGIAHGPQPRDYTFSVPKKVRRGALRSALSEKVAAGRLLVVNEMAFPAPRTRDAVTAFRELQVDRVLVVDTENETLRLSVRNLPGSKYLRAEGVNVYDVLKHEFVLMTESALKALDGALKS